MIHTVIFDIGNVLMNFDWEPYIKQLLGSDAVIGKVNEAIWSYGYWNEFDRGVLSEEEIINRMIDAAPEYEKEIRAAIENAGGCMHRCEYAIPWIQQLKAQGYQVLFLSNYSEYLMRIKPEVLDFLPYTDGGIFSCHVKVIKPDRAIYEKICEKYQLNPEECLFIDDNQNNIKAARAFGLHGIRFMGYEKSFGEIMEYLVCQHG